jgi:hypothetical protein
MSLLPVLASSSISARNVNGARWFCGIDLGTTNSLSPSSALLHFDRVTIPPQYGDSPQAALLQT